MRWWATDVESGLVALTFGEGGGVEGYSDGSSGAGGSVAGDSSSDAINGSSGNGGGVWGEASSEGEDVGDVSF